MIAARIIELALARGASIAVAESLTGGALAAALIDAPGASHVVRLGVVAYDTAMKASVLGVDAQLLAARGAVDPEVAEQMARGVRALADRAGEPCTIGISTTGVAGPDPQDGHPVGEVWIGISQFTGTDEATSVHRLDLSGGRAEIRAATVQRGLEQLIEALERP